MLNFGFNILKKFNTGLLLIGSFTFFACDDVIENNIQGKSVPLLAPPAEHLTSDNFIAFIWGEVEGALEYELEIASPSFAGMVYLIQDTTTAELQFSQQLDPGSYQWRIRAKNGSGTTNWYARNLQIDSTSNLALVQFVLITPADQAYLNDSVIAFSWSGHHAVNAYDFNLYNDHTGGTLAETASGLIGTTHQSTLSEGQYAWTMQAFNGHSSSDVYAATFSIDLTVPGSPVPSFPPDQATVGDTTLLFSWARPADMGTNPTYIKDSLYFHSDTLAPAGMQFEVDGLTHPQALTAGQWFWRLRSFDQAGNISGYSDWFTFNVQ